VIRWTLCPHDASGPTSRRRRLIVPLLFSPVNSKWLILRSPSRPKPLRRREPLRGQPPRPRSPPQPLAPFRPRARAAVRRRPRRALLCAEGHGVAQAAFAVALELDALASRHLGELGGGEDQELAVVAYDGEVVGAVEGDADLGGSVQDLLAGAAEGDGLL